MINYYFWELCGRGRKTVEEPLSLQSRGVYMDLDKSFSLHSGQEHIDA